MRNTQALLLKFPVEKPMGDFQILDLMECTHLLPRLALWHQSEWSHLNPGQSLEERMLNMQSFLLHQTVPTTLVAVEDGEPIGSAALVDCDMEDRSDWAPWLASVFIAPDHRKQGVATRLIGAIEKLAADAGYAKIWLYTEDKQSLYRKLGWVSEEKRQYHGHSVECMSKQLQ